MCLSINLFKFYRTKNFPDNETNDLFTCMLTSTSIISLHLWQLSYAIKAVSMIYTEFHFTLVYQYFTYYVPFIYFLGLSDASYINYIAMSHINSVALILGDWRFLTETTEDFIYIDIKNEFF